MFPFFFMGMLGADWFTKLLNGTSNSTNNMNNSYNPLFDPNTFLPSNEILALKGKIEGFRNVAYQSGTSDPVTVGTGLTKFYDGTRPIKGRFYTTEFLNQQLKLVSKSYITSAKNLANKRGIIKVNQRQMDVLYYMFFNGFVKSRQDSWLQNHISDKQMANWMFTKYGIGPNFLVGADRQYFVGIITSRFHLANFLLGRPYGEGLGAFLKQFPKKSNGSLNQVLAADMYNQGKIKTPYYL